MIDRDSRRDRALPTFVTLVVVALPLDDDRRASGRRVGLEQHPEHRLERPRSPPEPRRDRGRPRCRPGRGPDRPRHVAGREPGPAGRSGPPAGGAGRHAGPAGESRGPRANQRSRDPRPRRRPDPGQRDRSSGSIRAELRDRQRNRQTASPSATRWSIPTAMSSARWSRRPRALPSLCRSPRIAKR